MMEMYPARGLERIADPANMSLGQCRKLRKLFVVGNSNRVAPGPRQLIETARFAPWSRLEGSESHFPRVIICAIMSDEY
jgi:hypothetical protein